MLNSVIRAGDAPRKERDMICAFILLTFQWELGAVSTPNHTDLINVLAWCWGILGRRLGCEGSLWLSSEAGTDTVSGDSSCSHHSPTKSRRNTLPPRLKQASRLMEPLPDLLLCLIGQICLTCSLWTNHHKGEGDYPWTYQGAPWRWMWQDLSGLVSGSRK